MTCRRGGDKPRVTWQHVNEKKWVNLRYLRYRSSLEMSYPVKLFIINN